MKDGFVRWVGRSIIERLYSNDFKDFIKFIFVVCLIPLVVIGLLVWLTDFVQLFILLAPISFILIILWFAYDSYEPKGCS